MNLRIASVIAVLFALSAASAEATIIDSFGANGQFLYVSYSTPTFSNEMNTGSAIGGVRDIQLQWYEGATSLAEVVVGPPKWTGFFFTQGEEGEVVASVVWDGNKTGLSGSINPTMHENLTVDSLTGKPMDHFLLDIVGVTGTGMNLTMALYSADGSNAVATSPIPLSSGPGTPLSVFYSSFTQQILGSHSVDLTDVGAIVLTIDGRGNPGADIRIRSVSTGEAPPQIPEPSTLALVAVGTLGILGLRKRRSRA
jgi:hypothetical protein